MTKFDLLVTDFDGVLCDSARECLLVTYNAYHRLRASAFSRLLDIQAIPPETQRAFRQLRPYLKGAEDFIPIFTTIEQRLPISSQREFDDFRETMRDQLAEYVALFYAERDVLIRHAPGVWLSLNPLFDDFAAMLRARSSFDNMYILTTKRQEDVLEIFRYQQVNFPARQIMYVKAAGKTARLLALLQEVGVVPAQAVYIEDQVDFLAASKQRGVQSFLVEWGYVSAEQQATARQEGIPIIAMPQLRELFAAMP